jgi:hypothetical protein
MEQPQTGQKSASRSSIFYFGRRDGILKIRPPAPERSADMIAIRDVDRPLPMREPGQDGQSQRPPRLLPLLLAALLLLLTGLLLLAHGCGQHDHDDELLLPAPDRPAAHSKQ